VTVRTPAPAAAAVLATAGATVTATGADTVTVVGLAADAVAAVLTARGVPFSEVSAHRATLEEAYLRLTRDAVEFRAGAAPEAAR
jgi:ABC-2 type transport system ATP-binding protein